MAAFFKYFTHAYNRIRSHLALDLVDYMRSLTVTGVFQAAPQFQLASIPIGQQQEMYCNTYKYRCNADGPTAHWSGDPFVRRPIGPTTHWSDGALVGKSVIGPKKCVIGPTAHWSKKRSSVRKWRDNSKRQFFARSLSFFLRAVYMLVTGKADKHSTDNYRFDNTYGA